MPDSVWTVEELLAWADSRDARSSPEAETVERMLRACSGKSPTHLAVFDDDAPEAAPRVKMVPVDVSGAPPTTYPRRDQKVILMSATISDVDLHQLGLDHRRVLVVDVPSDIPVDRRPIYFDPILSMTYGREDEAIRILAEWLEWSLREAWPGVRGVVHLPYRLGEKLMGAAGRALRERGTWFKPGGRGPAIQAFLQGPADAVLVAAGCHEGLDLKDDLARFQVFGDAPLASLGDPGVRWLHENAPRRAEWESVKTLAQGFGRVSRHPEDFGETVVVDAGARRILDSDLLPGFAREALISQ